MSTRIVFFDKIKNWMMPHDSQQYSGFDFFWRVAFSSILCTGLTLGLSYPFDLIHTRTSADMTKKNTTRLYTTTFDCFNRTNLEEGRWGLYKGAEIALASSLLRSIL
jgi:Mitochondrial carrier protein